MLSQITDYFRVISSHPYYTIEFWGNSMGNYVIAFVAFILFIGVFKVFQMIILGRLHTLAKKTDTDIDDTFIDIVRSLKPPFYSFLAFYVALKFLTLGDVVNKVLTVLLVIWVVYQVIIAVSILIEYVFKKTMDKQDDASAQGAIGIIKNVVKGLLWVGGIMMILSNLGVDITAMVAGLGIGGLAIAFAFQNILEDLFSSFAILFDKPFQIGDFIVLGDKMGTVTKIGIKTTRIRSILGEEIVVSNKELTSAQLQNFKKMEERRIVFSLGTTYETPTKQLKKIPGIVTEIIEAIENVRFDRAHFKSFDDSALVFEIVYYVTSGDYGQYMDIQQEINFKIREVFEKESIDMAYPTQTIYLQK